MRRQSVKSTKPTLIEADMTKIIKTRRSATGALGWRGTGDAGVSKVTKLMEKLLLEPSSRNLQTEWARR